MAEQRKNIVRFLMVLVLCGLPAYGEIPVTGRVVSSHGPEPSKISVSIYATPDRYTEGELVSNGESRGARLATIRTTTDGRFALDAPSPGPYTIVVEAPGHSLWEYPLALVEPIHLPTVTLTKAIDHRLRIVDSAGRAVKGGMVRVAEADRWSRLRPESGDWLPATQLVHADEDGQCFFRRETVRGTDLLVWAPGHLETAISSGKRSGNEIQLEPATQRTIEVRDTSGEPLANVLVRSGVGRWPVGWTDVDGRLELGAPADRNLSLELITSRGQATVVTLLPETATATADTSPRPEVLYLERWRVEGRVLSATDNEPLAGALLFTGADRGRFAWTDEHGAFVLPTDRPPTEITLFAEAPRHLSLRADGLPLDRRGRGEIVLPRSTTLSGTVVDEEDRPVPDVELHVHSDLSRDLLREPSMPVAAVTGEHGRFRLSRLPDAPVYELIARAPGFAASTFAVSSPGDDEHENRLVLKRGGTATGSVYDASGAPVPGAVVLIYPSRASQRERLLVDDVQVAQTVADGSFTISNVLADRYELGVTARGFAPSIVRGLEVGDAPHHFDLGTVFLEPESRLRGRVTDPDGQPLTGVTISYLDSAYEIGPHDGQLSTMKKTFTDHDGRFELTELEAGRPLDLQVRGGGYEPHELFGVEVPGSEPLTVVLEPVLAVTGHVVGPDDEPVPSAQVVMSVRGDGRHDDTTFEPDFGRRTITTDARGRFTLTSAEDGIYILTATAEGFLRSAAAEIEIDGARAVDDLTLVLGRGTQMLGRIEDWEGLPVTGARVRVTDPSPRRSEPAKETSTRRDGSYVLEGLAPGATTIEIVHRDHPPEIREITLRETIHRLDVTLGEGFELSGRVWDESYAPVVGAELRLESADRPRKTAASDASGRFRFTGVTAGSYRVHARKDGHAETMLELQVDASGGTDRPLDLELDRGGEVVGQVTGLDPAELARVRVEARRTDARSVVGTVDFTGQFRLERLTAGEWTVEASLTGSAGRQASRPVRVEVGAEVYVELDFDHGLVLSGTIVRGGEPVDGALVSLVHQELVVRRGDRCDPTGRFRLTGIEAGVYELTVNDLDTGELHHRTIDLNTDRDLFIELWSPDRSKMDSRRHPSVYNDVWAEMDHRLGAPFVCVARSVAGYTSSICRSVKRRSAATVATKSESPQPVSPASTHGFASAGKAWWSRISTARTVLS